MRITPILLALFASACTAGSPDAPPASNMGPAPATSGGNDAAMADPVTRGQSVTLANAPFTVENLGNYDEPWAGEFMPGSNLLFITGKKGTLSFIDVETGRKGTVSGLPEVEYQGQGGLGDIKFGPDWSAPQGQGGDIYLSWIEAGPGDTRGAVVGRGKLLCESATACEITSLAVIWRQDKQDGAGHYSHRLAFSPDGQYLIVTSGDRQEQDPAQDTTNNLGAVLRLNLDGTPASGNPMYDAGGSTAQIWSYGHRNLLGVDFAPDGRLWTIEMGPKHGDELNLIAAGENYGWPQASYGDNYNGVPIPDHRAGDGYNGPEAYWDPATSPAGLIIYSGNLFADWRGDAVVPGLSGQELNVISLNGERATGMVSYDFDMRLRDVVQGPDGSIYVIEDDRNSSDGTLMRLRPKG